MTNSSRPVLAAQKSFARILQSPTKHSMKRNNVCTSGLKITGIVPPAATTRNKRSQKKKHVAHRLFTAPAFPNAICTGDIFNCETSRACVAGSGKHVACTHVFSRKTTSGLHAQRHVCSGRSAEFLSGQKFQGTCSNMSLFLGTCCSQVRIANG